MKTQKLYLSSLLTKNSYKEFVNFIKTNSLYCNLTITGDEYAKIIKLLQKVRNLNQYKVQTEIRSDFILLDIKSLEKFGINYVTLFERDKNYNPKPKENITEEEKLHIDKQINVCKSAREKTKKQLAVIDFYELKRNLKSEIKNDLTPER